MDVDILFKIMLTKWKIKQPNLLISVIGGAKNFHMTAELKDVFRNGLVSAAESTGRPILLFLHEVL